MPAWNLGEIMSAATARAGRRDDIPLSVVSQWANQAYHDIIEMTQPQLLERLAVSSTTSGENRITLPTDFNSPLVVSWLTNIGSTRTLHQVAPDVVDATGFTPVGVPDSYVLYGNWMELYPSPNSAYSLQVRYNSYATDLLAKADIPSLSSAWRFPVVLRLEKYLHEWLGDYDRAAAATNAFLEHTSFLETDKAKRQKDRAAMRVKVVW